MNRIRIPGYRGEPNRELLRAGLDTTNLGQPAWRKAAHGLLDGVSGPADDYAIWQRWRGRQILRALLATSPRSFDLVPVLHVDRSMTVKELAEHISVSRSQLLSAVAKSGLPTPPRMMGRSLKGRAYKFSAELANKYIDYFAT